jgi:predicted nucleic acid-binding protein
MTAPVVADAAPIINFARANQLGLLRAVFPALLIPEAVYHELVVKGAGRAGSAEVSHGDWAVRTPIQSLTAVQNQPPRLHAGEREAIALAHERQLVLLIDEEPGRKAATQLGIQTITTLDVLDEAKTRGLISDVQPLLDQFVANGFYLDQDVYDAFLKRVGERT